MAGRGRMGSTFKIEPFKHPIAMDPNYADKTWRILESAIREIHNHNASGLSFEELYRNAYNMVLHKFGDKLYSGVQGALTMHLKQVAAQVVQIQDVPFLRELVQRWQEHNKSTQMIRDILMYMDRTYVQQQQKVPVFQLGLDLWRDQVIRQKQIHERFQTILSELVARERAGEMIDKPLLRSITQMLMDLGKPTYEADFEQKFLSDAADFYRKEAAQFLATCEAPEYMQKAERRLQEEVDRVRAYLDDSTEPRIVQVAEQELIAAQMERLANMEGSGLITLLTKDAYEDLARMYSLFRRVENGLELLKGMLGGHVTQLGMALMTDSEKVKEAVPFVKVLLEMREKFERIIVEAFGDDKGFRNTLNSSFENFLEKQHRSAEYLSLYIDDLLKSKKSDATDGDLDGNMDKVMSLFRYLKEKDVFEQYYKVHLSKRLLANRMYEDAERNMLVKLKTECGYQFTSKLECMFNDVKTSKEMMSKFKEYLATKGVQLSLDMSVQVLTTGSWPSSGLSQCQLPPQMAQAAEVFSKFYVDQHGGRKLTWQSNMGNVDLRATYPGNPKRYEMQATTYQALVLLLFNDRDSWSFKELQQQTSIPAADLKRALQGLMQGSKGKDGKPIYRNVLLKEPKGREVNDDDVFTVNDAFTSKMVKVKLNAVSASKQADTEVIETRSKVDEDRKYQIDAAIVRIMKARRAMEHNQVLAEVINQLQPRFMASPADIKKRIENLIEREFLERDSDDRKKYKYLA